MKGPTGAHRLVRLFDFDDARNPDPTPPGWERTTLTADGSPRSGFPKFNRAEIDRKVAFSGSSSVRLPTSGGCTSLRLRAGEAAIFEDADYAVSARIRTDGLEHARAFITARLLDQHLAVIQESEVRSHAVLSQGAWQLETVQVPGGQPGAAWLQIDLELLQPRQFTPPPANEPAAQALERHRLYREDVRGSAWFDDVAVMQIPRAEITTQSPSNLLPANDRPMLRMTVRDLGGEDLRGRVRVMDVRGRVIDETVAEINPDGRPVEFTPRLTGFGWYRAELEVLAGSGPGAAPDNPAVSRAETRFIWLARAAAGTPMVGSEHAEGSEAAMRARAAAQLEDDRTRFGLCAEQTPDERVADLPELVSRLGTRFLYLPAWQNDSTLESAGASLARRRAALEALLRQGQTLTFSINGLPSELSRATQAAADDALALAATPASQWLGYMTPMLEIFGQRVGRYQLGGVGGDQAFWRRDLPGDVEAMETALATLVPGPMLALPWPADRALPALDRPAAPDAAAGAGKPARAAITDAPHQSGPLVDALTVWYPSGFAGVEMPAVLNSLMAGQPPRELTVVLDLPRPETFGETAAVTELMRRVIGFWTALGDGGAPKPGDHETVASLSHPGVRIALNQPWKWSPPPSAQVQIWPEPTVATLAVLMDRLGGRRVVGELDAVAGVKCFILAARNATLGTLERGALVAWNETADPERAVVDAAAVGAAVTVVDAFGNQTPIMVPGRSESDGESAGSAAASPLVSVPLSETPVFIEGIDPYLALFAASFRLEPGFMPAVVREHEHRIILSNPWPVRITGKLQLKEDAERTARRRTVTDEWRVSPSGIIDFDIAPGQTAAIPVTLSYGPGQLAGVKDFVIIARAIADRPYPPIRLHASVEVGLEDIEMNPELQLTTGSDVVVVAAVTNKGTRARTLRLETTARNLPGQQLQISDLPPGQTVLRRFVFKDSAKALSGRRVVVSLSDLEEAQRLNKAVLVP